MEWNYKVIKLTGMWLASLVGAVYGLLFTIIGAGFNWGPGGGMEGPYWKIVIVGLISLLTGLYAGEFTFRKLTGMAKVFDKPHSKMEISLLMFLYCSIAAMVAWVLSWETGFISGILLGAIDWNEPIKWFRLILDVALMSTIFGIPLAFGAGVINALVAWFVLRK